VYKGRVELVLVSPSDSYSDDAEILVCNSRPSSCSVYMFYWLLTLDNFGLRKLFYSKQCFKSDYCSSM